VVLVQGFSIESGHQFVQDAKHGNGTHSISLLCVNGLAQQRLEHHFWSS